MIWVGPLFGEEAVGGADEAGVVVKAEVAAAFVVIKAQFALELFVVESIIQRSRARRARRSGSVSAGRLLIQ